MYSECLAILGIVTHLLLLTMVSHKLLNRTQGHLLGLMNNGLQSLKVFLIIVEFCKALQKRLLLTHTYISLVLYL